MKQSTPWELSDGVWERVRPLIPRRLIQDDQHILSTTLYVLRTGALPRALGASTTVSDRFRL